MGDGPVGQMSISDGQHRIQAPFALPSLATFKEILRRAADQGRVTWSKRFQARCRMHGFSTVDAVNVIREGRIVNFPVFDQSRNSWRVNIGDAVDGSFLVVDVALSCEEDFSESPRVEIVTAFYRRGRRKEVRDWGDKNDETEDA